MKLDKRNIQGLVGTIIFHGALLIVLLMFAFTPAPHEFPEPEGIMIDFGELVQGDEASGSQSQEQQVAQPVESAQSSSEQNVVTQDVEDAITIPKETNTTTTEPVISPEERERQERERLEQIEKARIDALFQNKLDGSAGNSETGARTGLAGDPNATSRGSKKGTPGNPFGNKDVTSWAKPTNTQNCNKSIQLTVQIDNMGNVTAITKIETALSEQACIEAARKAALKVKFPSEPSLVGPRYANIVYDYTISAQ